MSNPLSTFFASFPGFTYVASRPATKEFRRMCKHFGWELNSRPRENARAAFRDALVMEFNEIYGTDKNDIASWHALCRVLAIDPVPVGLPACRKVRT